MTKEMNEFIVLQLGKATINSKTIRTAVLQLGHHVCHLRAETL